MAKNANLLLAGAAILVVVVGAGGLFAFRSQIDETVVKATSDVTSVSAELKIGMDSWMGYMPLCSDILQNTARRDSIRVTCVSDNGDYGKRLDMLRSGELDLAVATVDANLLNAESRKWPGVIVTVLDQSNGGDALVCKTASIASIDDLSHRQDWKIAFTPSSPSHHLLRSLGNDFGIDGLLGNGEWRIETNGSSEALSTLQANTADCAVLWQPDVARALKSPEYSVVHSSANADKLIVDVLMARRELLLPTSNMAPYVTDVMRMYFETLTAFEADESLMLREAYSYLRTFDGGSYSDEEVQSMLDGVAWINLRDNGERWFGIGQNPYFGLSEAHESALAIVRAEEGQNFLRYFRPEQVVNSSIAKTLYDEGVIGQANRTITDPLKLRFSKITEGEWGRLKTLGTLRSRRVVFESGSNVMTDSSRAALGEAMTDFKRYPNYRLELRIGYLTNTDVAEAQAQATARASQVREYLLDTFGLDSNRVHIYIPAAYEIDSVIPRRENEGGRSYQSRLREIQLVLRD